MKIIAAALLLACASAGAQTIYSPIDLSAYAKTTDVPVPYTSVPLDPTTGGQAGGGNTFMPSNARLRLVVQAANTTTDASGLFSVTFNQAFANATPIAHAFPIVSSGATQPGVCNITGRSSTTITGKCFGGQSTLLSLSIVTTGLTVNPFSTSASGIAVMVLARDSSQ